MRYVYRPDCKPGLSPRCLLCAGVCCVLTAVAVALVLWRLQ